jgi:hypothetical protein
MSSKRKESSVPVDSIAHQNSGPADFMATICCDLVFSLKQSSASALLVEDCVKVELKGSPDRVCGLSRNLRELPSVVTWLQQSPTPSQSSVEYCCGQSVFESGIHYFEILAESSVDSSAIPLIGIIEADAAPTSSERFCGLCLSALTARNTQRRLVGGNALGSLDLHECNELDTSSDGVMVCEFLFV